MKANKPFLGSKTVFENIEIRVFSWKSTRSLDSEARYDQKMFFRRGVMRWVNSSSGKSKWSGRSIVIIDDSAKNFSSMYCPLSVNGVACNRRIAVLYLPPGAIILGAATVTIWLTRAARRGTSSKGLKCERDAYITFTFNPNIFATNCSFTRLCPLVRM